MIPPTKIFSLRRTLLALAALMAFAVITVPAHCAIVENEQAPGFSLVGTDLKPHFLSDYRGKPLVLFFFCGCKWCHDTARAWAIEERKHAVPGLPVPALIVYSGPVAEATEFARQTGLDLSANTLLADEEMSVSYSLYGTVTCPRVFVLTPDQIVVYTNNHKDDEPRTITGAMLVSHILTALSSQQKLSLANSSAASIPATPAPIFLTPVATDDTDVQGTGLDREAHFDFGTVKQSETKTIEHVFQFRNDTGAAIQIDHIQPSCGCTNAFINNTADYPIEVKPGATISVTAYVDLTDLYPTDVEKSVMIFRADQLTPVGMIDITGKLTP